MARKPNTATLEKRLDEAVEKCMNMHHEMRALRNQQEFDRYVIDELVGKIAEARLNDVLKLIDPCFRVEINIKRK